MSWTMIAAAAAPAAFNLAGNLFTSPKKSAYEKKLTQLADYFGEQSLMPYLQTTEGRSGMQMLDRADEKNRKRATNQGIRTGQTDEAKMAGIDAANEAYAGGVNRLVHGANRYRGRMMQNQMQALGSAHNAQIASEQQWQNQIGGITQGVGSAAQSYIGYKTLKDIMQ